VGDTYCYLAGTVLAVSGILGHFSKTMLLFMFPQVINFVYSCPQLFRLIPCPRHRMPVYVPESDCVGMSYSDWIPTAEVNMTLIGIIDGLGLAKVEYNEKSVRISNLTVINFVLWKVGKPMKEATIVNVLLILQLLWTVIAFVLRYKAAGLFYTLVD
jgi:UDP-N-acetylglucosamine--dolichyl-phosphate N-acetylglucosaminephosphotransferase